ACAGFLVGDLVVDGGVVVELGGDRVGGQGVGDLDGGVDVETRDVGDHAAEQGDFGRVALGEHTGHVQALQSLFECCVPQLCEFCGPVDDQVHDGVDLGFAEEEQVGGLLLLLGGLRDAQGFQEGGSEPPAILAPQLGTCFEPAGEQLQDLLGAGGAVGLGYGLGEFDAGGALPGLGGDACPAHTTVGGVLGGSGVVTVDVGRWDGL